MLAVYTGPMNGLMQLNPIVPNSNVHHQMSQTTQTARLIDNLTSCDGLFGLGVEQHIEA